MRLMVEAAGVDCRLSEAEATMGARVFTVDQAPRAGRGDRC